MSTAAARSGALPPQSIPEMIKEEAGR